LLNSPGRTGARALLIPVLALSWLLLSATGALANPAPIHIAGTGGEGVFIRPEPNTSRPAVGWMPEGASPDYNCFVWGQNIGGVPIWFNVTYNGVTGYYASYYDDSSYHSNEELTAKYGVPLCGSAPPAPPPSTPPPPPLSSASGGHPYLIVNAEDGIYYRNSPSWGDTSRTPGVGVYNGDQVELICGSYGDPVGPFSNKAWSLVKNMTRPNAGQGWVNEHFIDDGAPANGFITGEPACSAPSAPPTNSGGPRSVFYSPNAIPTGVSGLNVVADLNLVESQWVLGNCRTSGATNIPLGVSTLAGWSLGRLGPIYVLAGDRPRWPQIHRIILFDPGSSTNMSGCDKSMSHPSINDLLAEWLVSNSANRLEVYTGHDTEERNFETGHANFGGLWHYYFARIWNQPFASQVRVCDYPEASHEDVFVGTSWVVEHPLASCPGVPGLAAPISWHP
jgi:hypothetical protein